MIKAVIFDSLFPTSHLLIKSILVKNKNVSSLVANLALYPAKISIKNVLGFDVLGGNMPYKKVFLIHKPGLFMIGDNDEFI